VTAAQFVASPPPTPAQAYAAARYHYPLFELLPAPLRIPVAGPAPYNALAVVQTIVYLTAYRAADDVLRRRTIDVPTKLVVTAVDPLAPGRHPVQHSTTGTIRMMQTTDDTSFVIALDRVSTESHFDARGQWWFTVDVAAQFDQVFAGGSALLTSWVLYLDPHAADPVPSTPPALSTQGQAALADYQRYLRQPHADAAAAARELSDLVRGLQGAHTSDAVALQQLAVQALTGVGPSARAADREHVLLLAEARQTLVVRLLEDGRPADASALVEPMLDGYRAYLADGGDAGRVLREIDDPVKALLAAGLPQQALAVTRAHVDLLERSTSGSDQDRLQLALDLANARHNLVARLVDAGRRDEAEQLAWQVVRDYLAYAQLAGADRAEAVSQLRAFRLVVDGNALRGALPDVDAALARLG